MALLVKQVLLFCVAICGRTTTTTTTTLALYSSFYSTLWTHLNAMVTMNKGCMGCIKKIHQSFI